jgi:two-component system LytT family response regulator
MLRAIIIDDEQKGINSLRLLMEKFVTDVKIVAESTNARLGVTLIDDYKPEIVFLDINMPHLNGFELLQKLSFRDFNLIFTTAHQEYALKAIKSKALDYLLKPIDIDDLQTALNKVRKNHQTKAQLPDLLKLLGEMEKENKLRLPINTKDGIENVNIEEIVRLEADSNYTLVHMANKTVYKVSKTLKDFESPLCFKDSMFMRIHQSHIINLKHVVKYTKGEPGLVQMKDNYRIPLSKNKKEEFLKWLGIAE